MSTFLDSLLIGVQWITTWLLVHHLALWFGRRDQRQHLWVAAWCVVAATHQGGRLLHYETTDPEVALLAVRICAASVAMSAVVGIGAIRSLVGDQGKSRKAQVLSAISVGIAALVLFTPTFFAEVAGTWTDPVGRRMIWIAPTAAGVLWVPWGLACLGYVLRALQRATHLPHIERMMIAAVLVIYVAGAATVRRWGHTTGVRSRG